MSFGYEFGSPAHRDCTVAEGGNVAAAQSERVRQKREEYQAIFGSGNQPNAKTQYEIQVEPYLVKPGRNTFCHSGGSYCTN